MCCHPVICGCKTWNTQRNAQHKSQQWHFVYYYCASTLFSVLHCSKQSTMVYRMEHFQVRTSTTNWEVLSKTREKELSTERCSRTFKSAIVGPWAEMVPCVRGMVWWCAVALLIMSTLTTGILPWDLLLISYLFFSKKPWSFLSNKKCWIIRVLLKNFFTLQSWITLCSFFHVCVNCQTERCKKVMSASL